MAASTSNAVAVHGFRNFQYDPLDLSTDRPSIRLAILQADRRDASIRVTLANAAFADRPRYEALSYTWGRPDELKTIELNGRRVDVRNNLALALIHLRHATEDRVLWIDAICINQADLKERNSQVQLMSYIYTRARRVLVWLGIIRKYEAVTGSAEIVSDRRSVDVFHTHTLCLQPYWRRVWIVQEIGAATALEVHWGLGLKEDTKWESKFSPWDTFFHNMKPEQGWDNLAMRLAQQREGRHGDSYLLANLMEVCQDSLCEEPRDKVYGFVGIAHDCQDGTLAVDYSKSLFEIYEDVVGFHYFSDAADFHDPALRFNTKSIVHFSQLVQKLFGGPARMEQDLALSGKSNPLRRLDTDDSIGPYMVLGGYAGSIASIGCSYDNFIAVPSATRSWKASLQSCDTDLEKLRRKNEGFMRVLLDLDKAELDKIRPIDASFAWTGNLSMFGEPGWNRRRLGTGNLSMFDEPVRSRQHLARAGDSTPSHPSDSDDEEEEGQLRFPSGPLDPVMPPDSPSAPRLCFTRSGVLALVPSNAEVGDKLLHFWNSDVVALVRMTDAMETVLKIVGRAVIANDQFSHSSKFYTPMDNNNGEEDTGFDFEDFGYNLYMDIKTLQEMTQ